MSESSAQRGRAGFTIVELLVVLVILMLLLAIGLGGYSQFVAQAKKRNTEQFLANCQGMYAEYERATLLKDLKHPGLQVAGRPILGLPLPAPGDVQEGAADRNGPATLMTRTVMTMLRSLPINKTALEQLPSVHLWPGTTPLQAPVVLDGWRNPILFVPPEGLSNVMVNGVATTVRAPDQKAFFASAGKDGSFAKGNDNVYSFK